MDSNTHSADGPDGLGAVVAELQGLAVQAVGGLPDGGWAEPVLVLRGWWSAGKARGSPTSPPWTPAGPPAPTRACRAGATAAWLRDRLPMGAGTAAGLVRTARAVFIVP